MVLLKVSPWKGIIRFRKRGKLSARFVGPFKILARVGQVAYRLDLPVELSGIHPAFHVSHLRKCLADDTAHIPYDEIEVDNSLNYIEEPIAIIDRAEKRLRNKSIKLVKVQWKHRKGSEATWEKEDEMRGLYPQLFSEPGIAYLPSTQEGLPAYLPSTQEEDPAYLPSAQEGPSAHLSSAHEYGPAHLASAQAADSRQHAGSEVTLLDLCLGQPREAYQVLTWMRKNGTERFWTLRVVAADRLISSIQHLLLLIGLSAAFNRSVLMLILILAADSLVP
ncbi:hypothetical protein L1987_74344 [Smallanthus sonchifolius]|uniref:Uncharacterized protein n=1 Tax=Smallanthus sonchifolius TaxID=185202 RepID=A0ACB9A3E1_9ASTR|nr:hypothetical protein L1987_74344 [Smallanthus sonchifolius]